jgi:recombination protein RecA
MKIGVMFGNPETTTGGMALKFYSSVRIDVRRIETLKQGDKAIGNRVRAKVVKNKVAPPFAIAEFEIIFPNGISREGDILDLAVQHGIIEKSGTWFTLPAGSTGDGERRLGQGREAAKLYLKEHPELMKQLYAQVTQAAKAA